MIALVSALLGFISSAVPDFIKLFRESKDRAHEVTLLQLQMDYAKLEKDAAREQLLAISDNQRAASEMTAFVAEQTALNTRVKDSLTGIHWVDALAGSVRPVLTYAFFMLYGLVKCAQFYVLVTPGMPWQQPLTMAQALVSLWTEEDIAIFSAVVRSGLASVR